MGRQKKHLDIKVYFSGREAVIHLVRRNENWQVLREDPPQNITMPLSGWE